MEIDFSNLQVGEQVLLIAMAAIALTLFILALTWVARYSILGWKWRNDHQKVASHEKWIKTLDFRLSELEEQHGSSTKRNLDGMKMQANKPGKQSW